MKKFVLALGLAAALATPVAAHQAAKACDLATFERCKARCQERFRSESVIDACVTGCRIGTGCSAE